MVSSHILPELADICNKVGIIERGELLVSADVADVMRRVRQQPVLQVAVAENAAGAAQLLSGQRNVEHMAERDGAPAGHARRRHDRLQRPPSAALVQAGYKLILFKEDEINLETAFMALTKGITA